MGKFFSDRPTLRGFLIIGLIALVVVVLNLYTAVIAIGMLLRIAFFLAIAFFIYLVWRERRGEIAIPIGNSSGGRGCWRLLRRRSRFLPCRRLADEHHSEHPGRDRQDIGNQQHRGRLT